MNIAINYGSWHTEHSSYKDPSDQKIHQTQLAVSEGFMSSFKLLILSVSIFIYCIYCEGPFSLSIFSHALLFSSSLVFSAFSTLVLGFRFMTVA